MPHGNTDFEEYGLWVECSTVIPNYQFGRIVDRFMVWRGNRHHEFGISYVVEFDVPLFKFLWWTFKIKERQEVHSSRVRILPLLDQLAREGK